jgi:RHS repeat-associated protein
MQSSLDILNYDSMGRITQYRQGNGVITNKSYDGVTGKLKKIDAALASAAAGSVQNNTYTYDSLHNLKTRVDLNTGVSENFVYDHLNRLQTYTVLGGKVSVPITIDSRYDARGNLIYKSDVGKYWYDPQRPNRLTNITLENFAGAVNNTGKRQLSYVYDDYHVNAKKINSTGVGNGNLMYTVSHDVATNKHTARFESYTSFNMPKAINYTNIGASLDSTLDQAIKHAGVSTGNPAGLTSDRTLTFVYGPEHQRTKQTVTLTNNAPSNLKPSTTYYLNGDDGMSLNYEKEIKTIVVGGVKTTITEHKHYLHVAGISVGMYMWREGDKVIKTGAQTLTPATLTYTCPQGSAATANSAVCIQTVTNSAYLQYSCAQGTLSGQNCVVSKMEIIYATPTYKCGDVVMTRGSDGFLTGAGGSIYAESVFCYQRGFGVVNGSIVYVNNRIGELLTTYAACPAGYEVYYFPGSVHFPRRCTRSVTQTVPASMQLVCANPAVETLVGSDCQSKVNIAANPIYTCPANAVLQDKNCVSSVAGDPNLAQQTVRYFHTDHLGSVVAVTNETGRVIERMAYDAWGKRRFTDGTSDNKDSLVGLTTDRGYTEHEMLDELGIIHMNGRIYDPYIGRFMSADPIIQDPYELQSHNRYSYVMNNPLFYTDPSGYSAWNRFRDNVLKPVVVIAVTYHTGNVFGTSIWGVIGSGAAGGATSALLNGGNFKQVLQGAAVGGLSSALFFGAGKIGTIKGLGGEYGIGHYAAHAAAGCVSSVAGGGQCGAGAASAVVGKAVTQFTSGDYWNTFTRGVAVSVGGGLASVAGGGTFANGTTTAAYGYLFNQMATSGMLFPNFDPVEYLTDLAKESTEFVLSVSMMGEGYLLLRGGVAVGEATTATTLKFTAHGAERIAGVSATRGGVLSVEGIQSTISTGKIFQQADGANVFLHEITSGRFNAVIQNQTTGKIITTMNNWSTKSINRMGKNYGWPVQ